jgi:hypothetical protein
MMFYVYSRIQDCQNIIMAMTEIMLIFYWSVLRRMDGWWISSQFIERMRSVLLIRKLGQLLEVLLVMMIMCLTSSCRNQFFIDEATKLVDVMDLHHIGFNDVIAYLISYVYIECISSYGGNFQNI